MDNTTKRRVSKHGQKKGGSDRRVKRLLAATERGRR